VREGKEQRNRVGEDGVKAGLHVKKVKRAIEGVAAGRSAGRGCEDSGHARGEYRQRGRGGRSGGRLGETLDKNGELSRIKLGVAFRGIGGNGVGAIAGSKQSKGSGGHGVKGSERDGGFRGLVGGAGCMKLGQEVGASDGVRRGQSGLGKSKTKFDSGELIGEGGISTAGIKTGAECKIEETGGAISKIKGDVVDKFTGSVAETETGEIINSKNDDLRRLAVAVALRAAL
jgi:hypothetical protein